MPGAKVRNGEVGVLSCRYQEVPRDVCLGVDDTPQCLCVVVWQEHRSECREAGEVKHPLVIEACLFLWSSTGIEQGGSTQNWI